MEVLGEERRAGAYIRVIKDMYDGVRTRIKTLVGDTYDFPIDIGLHQGLTLSPLLFTIVMNEFTRGIQDEIPWCMLLSAIKVEYSKFIVCY